MLIKIFQCCCLGVCDIVLLVRSVSRCGLHMTESWALDLRICVMVMDCHNHAPVLCTFRLWSLFLCVFFYVISAFGSHCSDRAYCFRMTYIFAHSSTTDCHFNFFFLISTTWTCKQIWIQNEMSAGNWTHFWCCFCWSFISQCFYFLCFHPQCYFLPSRRDF